MEPIPTPVPTVARAPTAKQVGETPSRWTWVEPAVWTERMLTALETGVKGGTWPKAFFARHGLFSLVAAHAQAVQSSLR
jgi:hypothetical protein